MWPVKLHEVFSRENLKSAGISKYHISCLIILHLHSVTLMSVAILFFAARRGKTHKTE